MRKALGTTVAGFTLTRVFARSRCSTLYVGRHEATGLETLIRDVDLGFLRNESVRASLVRDLTTMKMAADSPYVLSLYDIIESPGHLFVICERPANGTLARCVTRWGPTPARKARNLLAQFVAVVDLLHTTFRICHGNLTAETILLDKNFNVRVYDFAMSRQIIKGGADFSQIRTSPNYIAPEVVKGKPFTNAIDIWAIGILCYYVIVGKLPFDELSPREILEKILVETPVFPSDADPQAVDMIRRMLDKEPEHRITLSELKAHPFFAGIDWQNVVASCEDEKSETLNRIDTEDDNLVLRAVAQKEIEIDQMKAAIEMESPPVAAPKRCEITEADCNKQMMILAGSAKVKKTLTMARRTGPFTDVSSDLSTESFSRPRSDFA